MGPGRVLEGRAGERAKPPRGTDLPRPTRTQGDKCASLTTVFGRKRSTTVRQVDRAPMRPLCLTEVTAHFNWGSFFPGADVERIRASKDFLRHQGASRDSQRTGLNTRRDSEAGSIHSVMPSGRPTHPILCVHRALFAPYLSACSATLTLLARCGRGPPSEFSGTSSQKRQIREGNKQLLKELLEDNRSLHAECKQMKHALATTKKRIQQLEGE